MRLSVSMCGISMLRHVRGGTRRPLVCAGVVAISNRVGQRACHEACSRRRRVSTKDTSARVCIHVQCRALRAFTHYLPMPWVLVAQVVNAHAVFSCCFRRYESYTWEDMWVVDPDYSYRRSYGWNRTSRNKAVWSFVARKVGWFVTVDLVRRTKRSPHLPKRPSSHWLHVPVPTSAGANQGAYHVKCTRVVMARQLLG